MIVTSCFKGDNNEVLKDWQNDYYNDMLQEWLSIVYDILEVCRISGKCQNLVKMWDDSKLKDGHFDHRCLQDSHDSVATSFRFCAKYETVESTRLYTKSYWKKYFKKVVTESMQEEYAIEAFITALACANTEEGYVAEDVLVSAVQTVCDNYEPDTSQMELFSEKSDAKGI